MSYSQENFYGVGVVYIDGVDVGNTENATAGITTSKLQVKNFRNTNGGNVVSIERIETVEFTATLLDWSNDNLMRGLQGTSSATTATPFTDTVVVGVAGSLLPFDATATVTSISYAAVATYAAATEGVEYETVLGGIRALVSGNFKLTGTSNITTTIEALTAQPINREIVLALENQFIPGEVRIVKLHKVSLSPIASLDLLTGAQAKLIIKGEVLADTSKPAGKSQYFSVATKRTA